MAEPTERRRRLSGAAVTLVAAGGMRALTHRAVDAAAGLPSGTASYHFPTRKELVGAMLEEIAATSRRRITEEAAAIPDGAAPSPSDAQRAALVDQIVTSCTDFIVGQLTAYRDMTLARYACEVEVAAHPELAAILHAGDQFPVVAARACRALGVANPDAAGEHLLAFIDGIVHYRLLGTGALSRKSRAGLAGEAASAIEAYLRGLLAPPVG